MAKAELKQAPRPIRPPDVVVLELSRGEAEDLAKICGRFGGSPFGTVRETTDSIYDVLKDLGFRGMHERLKGVSFSDYDH